MRKLIEATAVASLMMKILEKLLYHRILSEYREKLAFLNKMLYKEAGFQYSC